MSKSSPSGWQLFPRSTENPVFFLANDFCRAMVNCFHGMVYKQTTLSLIPAGASVRDSHLGKPAAHHK